eukprot:5109241-Prymnesium_polylepis.1
MATTSGVEGVDALHNPDAGHGVCTVLWRGEGAHDARVRYPCLLIRGGLAVDFIGTDRALACAGSRRPHARPG